MSEHAGYAVPQPLGPSRPGAIDELNGLLSEFDEALLELESTTATVLRPTEPEAEVDQFPRETAIENVSMGFAFRIERLRRITRRVVL